MDANKFIVPWNYPRCPEVKLGIPDPTSGHQEVTPSRCPEFGLEISFSEPCRQVQADTTIPFTSPKQEVSENRRQPKAVLQHANQNFSPEIRKS